MKTNYVIIFESNSNGEKRITLSNYYFKTKKAAREYAEKFRKACLVKVNYEILMILPYNK